jgi:hypothetical protein
MTPSSDDPDDKVVLEPVELEPTQPRARPAVAPCDESGLALGKGTREQLPLPRAPVVRVDPTAPRDPPGSPGGPRARAAGTRELDRERDPVAVLRMWPHSSAEREIPPGAPAPMPARPRRVDDKVLLAHLALDLFHELGQIEAVDPGRGAPPTAPVCSNHACQTRINALRGGLVEACLLVQRAVMMNPAASEQFADRVRELLDLLER